jgi:hypothetical protein
MAWRFRKSLKFGPLTLNLSRSNVEYSIVGRGFRVGRDAGIEDLLPRQTAIFREDAK